MATGSLSKIRLNGTRLTVAIKQDVKDIHDEAMAAFLQVYVDLSHNFTGETQATFRQFRDYLSNVGIQITLRDVTKAEVFANKYKFPRDWLIPEKIANLPVAGHTTVAGGDPVFEVNVQKQGFKLTFKFESNSPGMDIFLEPEFEIFDKAKAAYKKVIHDRMQELFTGRALVAKVKSYYSRVGR